MTDDRVMEQNLGGGTSGWRNERPANEWAANEWAANERAAGCHAARLRQRRAIARKVRCAQHCARRQVKIRHHWALTRTGSSQDRTLRPARLSNVASCFDDPDRAPAFGRIGTGFPAPGRPEEFYSLSQNPVSDAEVPEYGNQNGGFVTPSYACSSSWLSSSLS